MSLFGDIVGGIGSMVEDISDAIGLPEEIGDLASLATNLATQNYAGALDDAADLLFDVSSDSGATGGTPALNDGEAWTELQNTNPEAFQEKLSELSESEQQQVQMSIQTHLQQQNRMFSMMTAISQAQHDTQKSIISNFRV